MGAPFVRNSANVVRNSDGSGSAVAEAHSIAQNILVGGRSLLFSVAYMIPRQMGGRHIRTPCPVVLSLFCGQDQKNYLTGSARSVRIVSTSGKLIEGMKLESGLRRPITAAGFKKEVQYGT